MQPTHVLDVPSSIDTQDGISIPPRMFCVFRWLFLFVFHVVFIFRQGAGGSKTGDPLYVQRISSFRTMFVQITRHAGAGYVCMYDKGDRYQGGKGKGERGLGTRQMGRIDAWMDTSIDTYVPPRGF